jgi:hypothetical protein
MGTCELIKALTHTHRALHLALFVTYIININIYIYTSGRTEYVQRIWAH